MPSHSPAAGLQMGRDAHASLQHQCASPFPPASSALCAQGTHPRTGLILNFAQHLAPLHPSVRLQRRFAVQSMIKSMSSKADKTPVFSEITHIVFPLDRGIIISACQLARTSRAHPPAVLLAARASCAAWWVRDSPFPAAGRVAQHPTAWKTIRAWAKQTSVGRFSC